jgi:hypothetical protein
MARARIIAGVVLVLLAACGGQPVAQPSGSTSTGSANVTGVLDSEPVPTCPAGEPCDPPMRATMLIFSRPGAADVTAFVSGDGSFAVHLVPGQYAIAAAPPAFGGKVEPSTVQVPAQGSVFLRLRIARSP